METVNTGRIDWVKNQVDVEINDLRVKNRSGDSLYAKALKMWDELGSNTGTHTEPKDIKMAITASAFEQMQEMFVLLMAAGVTPIATVMDMVDAVKSTGLEMKQDIQNDIRGFKKIIEETRKQTRKNFEKYSGNF